jgi:hypothetical protein
MFNNSNLNKKKQTKQVLSEQYFHLLADIMLFQFQANFTLLNHFLQAQVFNFQKKMYWPKQ